MTEQHHDPQQPQQPRPTPNPYEQQPQMPQQPSAQQHYPQYAPVPQPIYYGDPDRGQVLANYWLSVFFGIIPAFIFYLTSKDARPWIRQSHINNLNFQILRTGAAIAAYIFLGILGAIADGTGDIFIPVIIALVGITGFGLWAWHLTTFIITIIAAASAGGKVDRREPATFAFNLHLVKN